jgi:hypothetical protein
MKFKHYVITRNYYPSDYKFIENRIELIKKFTIPSLASQTCKDFEWILTGDHGLTDSDFSGINYKITKSFKKYIQENSSSNNFVITTRLDNDDCLLNNFISDVQAISMEFFTERLIDLRGYRTDLRDGCTYEDTSYLRMPSPFISLIEKVKNDSELKTVYFDKHTLMSTHFEYIRSDIKGWLQIIHDHNKLMNRPKDDVAKRGQLINPPDFLESIIKGIV